MRWALNQRIRNIHMLTSPIFTQDRVLRKFDSVYRYIIPSGVCDPGSCTNPGEDMHANAPVCLTVFGEAPGWKSGEPQNAQVYYDFSSFQRYFHHLK